MSDRFEEIIRRKQVLIDRCARDREELAASCRRIHLPLGFGAVLTVLGKTLKSYPILVAGLSTLLVGGYGGGARVSGLQIIVWLLNPCKAADSHFSA